MVIRFPISLTRSGWIFLIWSLVGGIVMAFGIDAARLATFPLPEIIQTLACTILRVSDALWLVMAAALVFQHERHRCGTQLAIRTFLAIALPSGAAEWLGTTTGILFGHYTYTGQFGWRLAGILPFTVPLAWYAVVVGAARLLDKLSDFNVYQRALITGALATVTDINLEPVAIHVRNYWQWTNGPNGPIMATPPFSNYLTWFFLAALLALAVPSARLTTPPAPTRTPHPAFILVLMNLLFFLAHLGRWLR